MHPQVDLKTKTNFAKAKKPHSQKSLLCVTVMSHRARRAVSRATVGGDMKYTQCQQICTYAHKCPGCQKVFHNICMLSMMSGTKSICIGCFESQRLAPESLDSHDYAPFSPSNYVPYHPFTKKYAVAKNLVMVSPKKTPEVMCYVLACLFARLLPSLS